MTGSQVQTADLAEEKELIDMEEEEGQATACLQPGNLLVPGLPVSSGGVPPPPLRVSRGGGGRGLRAPFALLPEGGAGSEIEEVEKRGQTER